jgi:galactokinase
MAAQAGEAVDLFLDVFGGVPPEVAVAPGRVNLIGDHTDYNDGFVLPMAIDRGAAAAFRARPDGRLRVHAAAYGETRETLLSALAPPGGSDFLAYVAAVAWAFREAGYKIPGLDLVLHGNVPIGAGLSSSAALELAVARAFCAAGRLPFDPVTAARLAQRGENAYVGMNCGLMDQFAAAAASEGCALLLDCRSLETTAVPLPAEAAVVVMDTGARRALATSAYNERRSACESVVAVLAALRPGVRALRDVDEAFLESARDRIEPTAYRRARHVVAENARPVAFAKAMARGDLGAAGRLMNDSHASLRDLYDVSSPELDLITDLARAQAACFGARLTGAGFGGCAVALVSAAATGDFIPSVEAAMRRARPALRSTLFACRPSAGARLLEGAGGRS